MLQSVTFNNKYFRYMVYTFQLVASLGRGEPSALYFEQLVVSALAAVRSREDAENAFGTAALANVWRLCEYLDAVDGQCLPIDKELYRAASAYLVEFMQCHGSERNREQLAQKSWAAHTVRDLLTQQARRERLRAVA